jgi:DNA polymerase-3 subunit beta
MKLICEKEELLKGLNMAYPAISTKGTVPVISNFLLSAENEKVKILATDLEISIQSYARAEIVEEGAITIPAKKLVDIVKEFQSEKEIDIRTDEGNKIVLRCGKSRFILNGLPKEDFPKIPNFPKENSIAIKNSMLIDMFKKTVFAASKDSQRYILNGVYCVLSNDKIEMAATDGRRLSYIWTTDSKISAKENSKIIIPTKSVNEITKILSSNVKSESCEIGFNDNYLSVKVDDMVFSSSLIEGIFPNYEQVIPKDTDFKVRLNSADTLAATRQMALLTDNRSVADRASAVKFSFFEDKLTISAAAAGVGDGETELDIEYREKKCEISFNPDFIKEILQNTDKEFMNFYFSDSMKPAILKPEPEQNYLCVVMPMRV